MSKEELMATIVRALSDTRKLAGEIRGLLPEVGEGYVKACLRDAFEYLQQARSELESAEEGLQNGWRF